MAGRVLVIEDEPGLVLALTDRLGSVGYDVDCATDGETGLERALDNAYDVIILDIMLPRKDGFEVCRDLRRKGVTSAILMLTARDRTSDKVVGLKLGADDYLTKPFESAELLARIEALLRRVPAARQVPDPYRFGDVEVKIRSAVVSRDGKPVKLSAREFTLLKHFIENRGDVLSRDELLDAVWGYNFIPSTRTVDVHVAWLRQKLEADSRAPRFIVTVHGLGYRFEG